MIPVFFGTLASKYFPSRYTPHREDDKTRGNMIRHAETNKKTNFTEPYFPEAAQARVKFLIVLSVLLVDYREEGKKEKGNRAEGQKGRRGGSGLSEGYGWEGE